jgi:hypothetical protein
LAQAKALCTSVTFRLTHLSQLFPIQSRPYPVGSLSSLIASRPPSIPHHPPVTATGRGALPLAYALIAALVAPPHDYALAVVDYSTRFDSTRLLLPSVPASALRHVHIITPARATPLREVLESLNEWLVGGTHVSMDKRWWGVVSIGAGWGAMGREAVGKGVDFLISHRGWLTVERSGVRESRLDGMSVEEALASRETEDREGTIQPNWTAEAQWGAFDF